MHPCARRRSASRIRAVVFPGGTSPLIGTSSGTGAGWIPLSSRAPSPIVHLTLSITLGGLQVEGAAGVVVVLFGLTEPLKNCVLPKVLPQYVPDNFIAASIS